ncbi:MAG: hypothetical protein HY823_12350 [Acidobacteria bacterium]|nr:hypothetical protein [Acidobacteriota bacterium]
MGKAAILAIGLLAASGLACRRPAVLRPPKPVPPGTVLLQFTKVVKDPIDLTLDGVRVPVQISRKGGKNLWIRGLAPGKHRYFLSSFTLAFGPDQGEFFVTPEQGTFLVSFSQTFKAVLYGTAEPLPPAEGIPGVTAVLEP